MQPHNLLFECAHDAFRILVPYPHDRIPVDKSHIPAVLVPIVPFITLAYLARRPDTHLLRLLLLPIVYAAAIGTAFRFVWEDPRLNVYNWGQGLLAEAICAKATSYAFHKEGMLRDDEIAPDVKKSTAPDGKPPSGVANGNGSGHHPEFLGFWAKLYDALALVFSMRGLGWKYGAGVYVPQDSRPQARTPFLLATLKRFLLGFLALDLIESLIKLVPDVGSPHGGTIFFPALPLPQRYLVSTALHFATGCALYAGFEMVYALLTLLAVGALRDAPARWPPIMDAPFASDSLHAFWARRWHQVLREVFFVFGGYAGRRAAGGRTLGLVLGTFVGSGLYHECAAYAMGFGFDWRVPMFFALQAPLLLMERVWRLATGRRVGGVCGLLWVYFCVVVFGQPLVDSWHKRGLAGALVLPPAISPTRQILIPLAMGLRS